jgi:murein DD-endopeptidase MepM/ murein hydrolase activator NlpD
MSKRGWVVGGLLAGLIAVVGIGGYAVRESGAAGLFGQTWLTGGPDEPGPRPDFRLPFACGERWRMTTYEGHNPEHKKLDMYRRGGTTRGSVVRASAAGEVIFLPNPGGVKIDHGGRWNTLYLHMDQISVSVGDQVEAGQEIGRVGSVGTSVAHLHYEQLFDDDGDGWARTSEMVYPVIQGKEYRLDADDEFPVVTSTNACR